jgi:hypothetical protein
MTILYNGTPLDVWAAEGEQLVPLADKVLAGWQVGEQPPSQFTNYLQATRDMAINYLRMMGIPDWDQTLDYAIGAVAQNNLQVFVAVAPNKSDQPPSVNWREWKQIRAPGATWSAPTGAVSRAAFDPSTVNLATLAAVVAALVKDLFI